MKVSEAIDRLEVGDEVWVKGVVDVVYRGLHPSINIREVGWFSENTEISLTEPQSEKVEVTEKQAELLRAFKGESIYELLTNCLVEDEELMAKARLFGYTVKPKRWVVKDRKGECVYELRLAYTDTTMVNTNKTGIDGLVFTNRAKAEAVATLVEGTVEEID